MVLVLLVKLVKTWNLDKVKSILGYIIVHITDCKLSEIKVTILVLQVPSHALMGISRDGGTMPLSPLGEACLRMDLTAIHEILEQLGYKDDEGAATEVCLSVIILRNQYPHLVHTFPFSVLSSTH